MIIISAGHHKEKRGACYNAFCEYPETVRWADTICKYLPCGLGYRAPNGYLRAKAEFANRLCPDGRGMAIEVHFNAAAGQDVYASHGCMTLHYPGSVRGIEFANAAQGAMVKHFSIDQGIRKGYYRLDPSKGVNFFIEKIVAPAIIIEPEFIYHKDNIQDKREECCKDIALALTQKHIEIYGPEW